MAGEQPQGPNFAELARLSQAPATTAAPAQVNQDDIFANATKPEEFLHTIAKMFGMGAFLPHNAGQVSIFSGLESQQGILDKPMRQGSFGMGDRGVLAQFATALAKNKEVKSMCEGIGRLEVQPASYADLGNFSSPSFAGMGRGGAGMDFGIG